MKHYTQKTEKTIKTKKTNTAIHPRGLFSTICPSCTETVHIDILRSQELIIPSLKPTRSCQKRIFHKPTTQFACFIHSLGLQASLVTTWKPSLSHHPSLYLWAMYCPSNERFLDTCPILGRHHRYYLLRINKLFAIAQPCSSLKGVVVLDAPRYRAAALFLYRWH